MYELILIIILTAAVFALAWIFVRGKRVYVASKKKMEKDNNKAEILRFLHENDKAHNKDLRELLGVSARTVVNYMDELESTGVVEQVGDAGQSVYYKLKQ